MKEHTKYCILEATQPYILTPCIYLLKHNCFTISVCRHTRVEVPGQRINYIPHAWLSSYRNTWHALYESVVQSNKRIEWFKCFNILHLPCLHGVYNTKWAHVYYMCDIHVYTCNTSLRF